MTYNQLLEELQNLDAEQLEEQVMAHIDEEYYPIAEIKIQEKDDRLRDGHPFLEIE